MTIENDGLALRSRDIGGLALPTLEFTTEKARLVRARVYGVIGNSVPNGPKGKDVQARWKVRVASRVKESRGERPWQTGDSYAITVGFSFHMPSHGNRKLDVENFIKPAIDPPKIRECKIRGGSIRRGFIHRGRPPRAGQAPEGHGPDVVSRAPEDHAAIPSAVRPAAPRAPASRIRRRGRAGRARSRSRRARRAGRR